ncbi:aspartate kinase [Woodsholea maritima]|uniref:aspartate kinase n=1 Tax=Woodsholea maritima TaxID=240237 RepID=UPI00039D916E|nr:aspartate kinase [Woodsholea maritima]
MPSQARPLVLKFGGTSVGSPERIRHSARIAAHAAREGRPIALVVSAMAGETDRILSLCEGFEGGLGEAETDLALSAGEQVSAALMALALREGGLRARAFLGWQIPIQAEGPFGRAQISQLDGSLLKRVMDTGTIPVIAGFQGIDAQGRVRTLGRGGSDLSAVAIAAALEAECDIYTDVDGVFTTDPRIVPSARRIPAIGYDEMLELAAMGAKVLQTRSVEFAKARNVILRVKSSFLAPGDSQGTEVMNPKDLAERRIVSGIAYARAQARIRLSDLPESPDTAAEIFAALAQADIGVDMIVQTHGFETQAIALEFSVEQKDLAQALSAVKDVLERLGQGTLGHETDLAKVSVVGTGLRGRADVARTLYGVLAQEGLSVRMVATSEIKISALVQADALEHAVKALHGAYGLEA